LHRSRREQLTIAVTNVGVWLSQRLFRKHLLAPVGTLAVLMIALLGYYHYDDARRAAAPLVKLNLQAGSQQQPHMAPSFSTVGKTDPSGRQWAAGAHLPEAPMPPPSLQGQSDFRKALAAYDSARAYQARERATKAIDRGDYAAAITSLNEALRSCANRCQPELRTELDSHLGRAQSALETKTSGAVAAASPSAVNAAAVEPAKSSLPLAWPVKGRITVSFGTGAAALARSHAAMQTAEGIAIAVPAGTDILAAADGIVSYVGDGDGAGKFLLIRHDNDVETGYGHLRRVLVIWNASSLHYKRALRIAKESAYGECTSARPADRAVGAE
jgi:murein DD-endopeptidase MepM/ murein hydrolase activator NlpD